MIRGPKNTGAVEVTLVILSLVAAATNVAGYTSAPGGRIESLMAKVGLLDGNRLSARTHRDLWIGNLLGPVGAVREGELALTSDMASGYRWCDLGEVLLEAGMERKAAACLSRAVELGPKAPHILMRAANTYFRLGDVASALSCTRRILAIVPDYDDIVFSTYTRMGVPIEQSIEQGLPVGNSRPVPPFLTYLLNSHSLVEAGKLWEWAATRKMLNDELADHYASALIDARQYATASRVWESYLGARGVRPRDECLFNGSFEHTPYGKTLDWRLQQVAGGSVDLDPTGGVSGSAALRIRFDGSANLLYHHVSQTAVVPAGRYRLEARFKTEGITSDEGIGLRIHDANFAGVLQATTRKIAGTTNWTPASLEITIPPPTRLLTIEVIRDASQKFDSAIGGTVWIDDVKLVRQGSNSRGSGDRF